MKWMKKIASGRVSFKKIKLMQKNIENSCNIWEIIAVNM